MNTKLKQSIIIIGRIKNQLNHAKEAIIYLLNIKGEIYNSSWDQEKLFNINTSMYGLIHYSFIWYAAFLDEFYNHFTPASDPNKKAEIIQIRTNCKPYLKTIEEIFGDIKVSRNSILAHGYRNSSGTPLTNTEINDHFNRLTSFQSIQPYSQLSNIITLIFGEIESKLGKIDESQLSLQDEEESHEIN